MAEDSDGLRQAPCRAGSEARQHNGYRSEIIVASLHDDTRQLGGQRVIWMYLMYLLLRYGDLLLEKAKENLELEMKQQEKSEEMAQNFQNEIASCHA